MPSIARAFLLWSLILCACSASSASPPPAPPTPTETPVVLPTTAVPPDMQNCGYQWAYQDLPELSNSFQESIRALQPEAQAYAFAFGENCLLNDGTVARFIPMETDFNITIPVEAAVTEEDMGEWIVRIMQVIEAIPAEQIVGPRPGRVSILFQSSTMQGGVNFYRDQYQSLPSGLSNAEIYQTLQSSQ